MIGKYKNATTKILHKCKLDNYEWEVFPCNILRGYGCPVCSGRKIGHPPDYKNSIWASDYKNYFSRYITEDDMKRYTPHSSKTILAKCPNCGQYKNISIATLCTNGLGCGCNDGQSYPNKFLYSVLNQLDLEFIKEYRPDWAKGKRYDIYIPDINCIIENHGIQHYRGWGSDINDLQQQIKNDLYKRKLAFCNGIKHYIEINCEKSELEWIKKSIMQSVLPNLIGFNECKIDWEKCSADATKNIVKEICTFYKDNKMSTKLLAKKFHIAQETAIKYLHMGTKLNWCTYDAKEVKREAALLVLKNRS